MKFDSQYPEATPGFRSPTGFCKADTELHCCLCEQPTSWFHRRELLFFCSNECYWRHKLGGVRAFDAQQILKTRERTQRLVDASSALLRASRAVLRQQQERH
jgi:hypothetical protein